MDADIVREIEFTRGLRGYNVAEVDSFLERIEGMLRRRDLELENLQKKVQELTAEKAEQTERFEILSVTLGNAQQEEQALRQELEQTMTQLEAQKAEADRLRQELEQTRSSLAVAQAEAVGSEQRCQVLEQSLTTTKQTAPSREELQKRLAGVGAAAKDSWKQISKNLKAARRK